MSTPDSSNVNLYLVGFMGTGKTTIGRAVAHRLRYQLLDSDHEIERLAGRNIPEIFASEGERGFRDMERDYIETGHPLQGCVVACGGGLVVAEGMLERLLARGVVVCLHASIDTILQRTSGNRHRPLLDVADPRARIEALYAEREPIYRRAGTLLLTDRRPTSEIIGHVLRIYRREAREWQPARERS